MNLACTPHQELFTVGAERLEHLESVVEECLDNVQDSTEELHDLAKKAAHKSASDADKDEGGSDDEEGDLKTDLECAVVDLERARMAQYVRLFCFCFVCMFSRSCASLLVLTMHSSGKTLYSSAFDCATTSQIISCRNSSLLPELLALLARRFFFFA